MHKGIKRILSCLMAVIITLGMLNLTAGVMERKESRVKNQAFLEEKQNFDVLFLGTSHMINGVYPMELWNDYGIVSYNLAGHSTPIATSYWVLKNALDYTKPKLVVIDCLAVGGMAKVSDNFDYTHLSFDVFPISITKIRAVNDLLSDDIEHSKWDLLFPFSQYHNRWNQLTDRDFHVEYNCEKGAEMRVDIASPLYFEKIPSENKMQGDTLAIEYLKKIIEECDAQGIEVLLTYLPFPADVPYQEEANRVYDIAEEYGVNYINFLDMNLVDYNTDCYDEDSHLNPSGARKVTDYLGKYITDNYDIEDQRLNPAYEEWVSDYEEYQEKKDEILIDKENPYTYMIMLTDHNYDIIFEVTNKRILDDKKLCVMLENLGIDYDRMADSEYVILHNRQGNIDYITEDGIKNLGIETCIGVMEKKWYLEDNYQLIVDDNVYCDVSLEDSVGIDMRVIVVNTENRELVESVYFMHTEDESIEWNTILCRVE